MKISIWDILTGLTLLGILCLVGVFGSILLNPTGALNPMRPPTIVPPIVIPTATVTPVGLPPTWTPTAPMLEQQPNPENALPTLRPSRTPEPTSTAVILPTFTPSKTVRVGPAAQTGGSCTVIYQSPSDGEVFEQGDPFPMRWTLKNNSTKEWRADSIDVRFSSGDRFHAGSDTRDLPYTVSAGGAIDILLDMQAPSTGVGGTYTSNWALMSGNTAVCRFYVTIRVQ